MISINHYYLECISKARTQFPSNIEISARRRRSRKLVILTN